MFMRINKLSVNENSARSKFYQLFLFLGLIIMGSIILSGAVSAAGLANTPQPKFHHDNNNTCQSQYKGPQTNSTRWKFTTGKAIYTSPAIDSDGTIYLGNDVGWFFAIYPNGTKKWSYSVGDGIDSSPAIDKDGTIYFGSRNGKIYALNHNGTKKWSYTLGNQDDFDLESPIIGNDGTIYIGSNYGNLYALNPNGGLEWNSTVNDIYSTPAIASDGTIYCGGLNGCLYALYPNGTQKWNYTPNTIKFDPATAPVIGPDGTIYFGCNNNLYAINPDGTKKWNTPVNNMYSSIALAKDGTIYCAVSYNQWCAINPTGSVKWTYTLHNAGIASDLAIGSDGTLYLGTDNLIFIALNPNGTRKWTFTSNAGYFSSPSIASDGTLYFGSNNGNLYAIKDLTVTATPKGGIYTGAKGVTLRMNQRGTIYYTVDGSTPTTASAKYTSSIIINKTTTLKFFAKNLAGSVSQVYTEKYVILDKTAPKILSTSPVNLQTGVSRTSMQSINFSEYIKSSSNYGGITLKNLSTGRYNTLSKAISNKILYIKTTTTLNANTWYQVTIPAKAIKDLSNNNLQANYTFKFKTGT